MTVRIPGQIGPSASPHSRTLFYDKLAAIGRFDITGIPPSFDKLVIEILRLRTDNAVTIDTVAIFLNGDTTAANYRKVLARHGSNSGGTGFETINVLDNSGLLNTPGDSATADYFGDGTVTIANYADNKTKVVYTEFRFRSGANEMEMNHSITHWESTAVINQITLQPINYPTDEFIADSEIYVYGVKY